jgi:hypothetical protein
MDNLRQIRSGQAGFTADYSVKHILRMSSGVRKLIGKCQERYTCLMGKLIGKLKSGLSYLGTNINNYISPFPFLRERGYNINYIILYNINIYISVKVI